MTLDHHLALTAEERSMLAGESGEATRLRCAF